jgi:hypothetical protein
LRSEVWIMTQQTRGTGFCEEGGSKLKRIK